MNCNDFKFSELNNMLVSLGIEPVDEFTLRELDSAWGELPYEVLGNLSKLAMLLSEVGAGEMDYSTFRWEPTSERVFAFDMEGIDSEGMYTFLLHGVSAIGKGELVFENISETPGGEDSPRRVEFDFCGERRSFVSTQQGSWYDLGFIDFLNGIITDAGLFNRIRFMSDGYQEMILFYCDEIWAQRFKMRTGHHLFQKTMGN